MLFRIFSITTVEEIDGLYPVVVDVAHVRDVENAFGRPCWSDADVSFGRLAGRKFIPAGRRCVRRHAGKQLPALIVIRDVVVWGDLDLVAYNGLTGMALCMAAPGARLLAQCGVGALLRLRYTGLGLYQT